jgi:hypothetical protein
VGRYLVIGLLVGCGASSSTTLDGPAPQVVVDAAVDAATDAPEVHGSADGALVQGSADAPLGSVAPRVSPSIESCGGRFVDGTASSFDRRVRWSQGIGMLAERCLRVRVGQTVTWWGDFGAHPLEDDGGTQPNPVGRHRDGVVRFEAPGLFGYVCGLHPIMQGAVEVIP